MTAKDKAESLVNEFRIILMNEDTDCGNEILCTKIAKQCALIAVDEIDNLLQKETPKDDPYLNVESLQYWQDVKSEINLL